MDDLKAKTIRGGAARTTALAAGVILRVGSIMILSRLLDPTDFGLIGMVTAFTGVLKLFRDFGLSAAAVQSATVTEEQGATLFWINVLAGGILTAITALLSPVVVTFYHEPRLFWITGAVGIGFLLNGAGVQHWARLQREMRFTALAIIEIVSVLVSTLIAVGAARAGLGYWALVAMTVSAPLAVTLAVWLTTGWVPGMPRRGVGIRSMMRFGGTVTLNGMVLHLTFNLDKVLLGRFCGADAVGIYGRAYQLIRMPTDDLNWAVGEVAFSALSRIQHDPGRFKRYFLRGYSLVLALTVPITIACALFADDIVFVLLGPKWKEAAGIFRLLAPTIVIFAIVNPLGWLLNALGLVGRGLKISLVLAPVMIGGYFIGLPAGPRGVALAYSAAMMLWVGPIMAWAVHGTGISLWDLVREVSRPFASIIIASAAAFGVRLFYAHALSPLPRLILDSTVLFVVYFALLLFVAGQKVFFLDLIRGWKYPSATEEKSLASA
jgi:PST family polysaccharide transporter